MNLETPVLSFHWQILPARAEAHQQSYLYNLQILKLPEKYSLSETLNPT